MKLISIFLASIILSLTAIPCCGEESNCQEEFHSCADEENKAAESEDDDPPCSPFYSCGACTGFSLVSFQSINTTIQKNESAVIKSFYHLSLSEPYKLALLKPPKQI